MNKKRPQYTITEAPAPVLAEAAAPPYGSPILALAQVPAPLLIRRLQEGLPMAELEALQKALRVPMDKLSQWLGIPKATLHRRKKEGRLVAAESDRVVRFARLLRKAVETLGSEENARQWLAAPQFGLGGAIPLAYAETEVGAREVEELLARIEYGIYG